MPYAVMQKSLEPPSIEQLRAAFRGVPGLTEADAHILGQDAFGILVKHFTFENATALQTALAAQGVETEVLEEGLLPELPPVRFVMRVDCVPDALMIYDPLGRSFPLAWDQILLIAAGKVAMDEFKQVRTQALVVQHSQHETSETITTKEQWNDRLLLEIVVSRAVLRYSITADKCPGPLFEYLGTRRTDDLANNFALLTQDLIRFAPQATINQGAYYLRENCEKPFYYHSKSAFYEEMTWLLWQLSLQGDKSNEAQGTTSS
jgi:hypothetical protein